MRLNGRSALGNRFGIRRDIIRGDSLFALLVCVVVGVFLINLTASVWGSVRFHKALKESEEIHSLRTLSDTLSKTVEALLLADELSALRRVISEVALENDLTSCTVTLPNGEIIADSEPARISVFNVPATWSGPEAAYAETIVDNAMTLVCPLKIQGRGHATLTIAAPASTDTGAGLNAQTTQMALGCLALAMILLIHRHARFRLKAIGAIHEALMKVKEGQSDVTALELNPRLGFEAVAWNKLISEHKGRQIHAAIQQVQASVQKQTGLGDELEAVCNAFAQGMLLVTPTRRVKYVNSAAAALLQTDAKQLVGQDISACIAEPRVLDLIQQALQNPMFQRTVIETATGESERSTLLRYSVRPVHLTKGVDVVLVTMEDITQQKVVEASRNGFLAHAAHELRTPLTTIQLYVEKALDDCQTNPVRTARSLSVINSETHRLESIVAEILSIAEIEAGSFSLQRDDVKLDVLFKQLEAEYRTLAEEKSIRLSFELPPKLPVLNADRGKITLAFHNLLGNAIKYTPDKGQVKVHVTVEDREICVRVSDTGIGIKEDDLEHIFDKFYRAKDKRLADITGSGLGLAIARELVRLHGGDITVESEFNRGSHFSLTLPVVQEVCVGEH